MRVIAQAWSQAQSTLMCAPTHFAVSSEFLPAGSVAATASEAGKVSSSPVSSALSLRSFVVFFFFFFSILRGGSLKLLCAMLLSITFAPQTRIDG